MPLAWASSELTRPPLLEDITVSTHFAHREQRSVSTRGAYDRESIDGRAYESLVYEEEAEEEDEESEEVELREE